MAAFNPTIRTHTTDLTTEKWIEVLTRLCNFFAPDVRIESLAAAILIHRIGLNMPSCELKLRPRGSMPESGVKKLQNRGKGTIIGNAFYRCQLYIF